MVGAAIGAAMFGQRPIVEIAFGEFLPIAMSQIVLQAANIHYMTAGRGRVPLVLRTRVGDGPYRGHPQSYEAWFPHVPGLKVVMPATPRDARALMRAAIRDDGPVLFFEAMSVYHSRGSVPVEAQDVSIGSAAIARGGRDVTIVTAGSMLPRVLAAAETLRDERIDVEVVDLRTLAPLDRATVLASVRKTGRLVIAHEAWKVGGFGAEVAAVVAEEGFGDLRAPIVRVGMAHLPVPSALSLRELVIPSAETIAGAVRQVCRA
jgi:pyruvate dehydrogenase E1 component beta subunit